MNDGSKNTGRDMSEPEKPAQVVSKLAKGDISMITACFDEYYFIIPEGVIKPAVRNAATYNAGDAIPVKGETYCFPADFNIIDLHFKRAAKIRNSRLDDIVIIDEFVYDGFPAVNMMGFGIRISSQEDFIEFKGDFSGFGMGDRLKLAAFANKWFDIVEYRSIRYI